MRCAARRAVTRGIGDAVSRAARRRADGAGAAGARRVATRRLGLGGRGIGRGGHRRRLDRLLADRRDAGRLRQGAAKPARCAPRRCGRSHGPADYLLAHQEYSPANALQGVGPYLRDVAATSTPLRPPSPNDARRLTRHADAARAAQSSALRRPVRAGRLCCCCARRDRRARRRRDAVARARRAGGAAARLRRHDRLPDRRRASRRRGSRTCTTDGREFAKLVNLDGPAREVVRSDGEVRCYYPDAKLVRVEPRHVPQRVPVAVGRAAAVAVALLRRFASSARIASAAGPCRSSCSSRRTGCATATGSGPTAPPACC